MNITFHKIYINNFLSIKESEVNLTDQGFVLVSGQNNQTDPPQSNGAGKSTIFDAIFWTMTGTTLRGASDVVNENAGKDGCLCRLEFSDGEHFYTIKRAKGHIALGNSCHFLVDGEVVSDQTKKSQEMIEKYLPFVADSEVLGSIILLGQGLPFKFSSFSPIKRKDMLEIMSGALDEIGKLKYQLDIKNSEVCAEQTSVSRKLSEINGKILGHQGTISALTSQVSQYSDFDNGRSLSDEIKKLEDQILNCKTSLEDFVEKPELSEKVTLIDQELERIHQLFAQASASYNLVDQQIKSFATGNCPTCGRPYDIDEEHLKMKSLLEVKKNNIQKTFEDLNAQKVELSNQRFAITEEINTRRNMTSTLTYQIQSCESKLDQLYHYDSLVKDLKEKISNEDKEIKLLKVEANDLEKEDIKLKNQIDCIDYLDRQISRDFKGYILSDAIKFMSLRAEKYGKYLFSNTNIGIELNGNKINILVGSRQYENLSGGERQRADLAVQFALRDMLSVSSGFSCNLLVLDEAFDNLDAQGSTALIDLITNEFTDVDSVFVITHHSEIDIPYDKQLIVIKQSDGNSYVN